MRHVIYVLDVGSPKAGLAWARLEIDAAAVPTGGVDLARAATRIADDIRSGAAIAIGFEAPGFIPVPVDPSLLGRARDGEVRGGTSRPWSYGAGAYVTTMAIQLGAWLLRRVKENLESTAGLRMTLDPESWTADTNNVLLWEAFVSGDSHARSLNDHGISEHIQDAATAAVAFRAWWETPRPRPQSAVSCDPRIATLGAVALWAGWTTDIAVLSQQALVLWPGRVLGAAVRPDDLATTQTSSTPLVAPDDVNGDPARSAAVLFLVCGDSHSFWRSHQFDDHVADFDLLVGLLEATSCRERRCEVSFDDGVTWQALSLRLIAENQVSWKTHNAKGSTISIIPALIRT